MTETIWLRVEAKPSLRARKLVEDGWAPVLVDRWFGAEMVMLQRKVRS